MLTKPDVADELIVACVHENFGLNAATVTFLPLGADVNSAVYRITAQDGAAYLLKLRRGDADQLPIAVPAYLHAQRIQCVMAPIATTTQRLWARAHGFGWILYPFFAGRSGFEASLSRQQWIALGRCMKAVHSTVLPADLLKHVPREDYAPRWRMIVKAFDSKMERGTCGDPIAAKLAAFWATKREEIRCIVERAERLAQAIGRRKVDFVLCHSDLHGGNVLVGADEEIAVVDWDEPILAPKERDLMFVGGGVGGVWNSAQESRWFYAGYGEAAVDPVALAYYRYERIVVDIAAYAEQILGLQGSSEDREEGLRQLVGQFVPGNVVTIAHESYVDPD